MLARLRPDLRYAVRSVLSRPLASLLIVGSLAVGIGVNTTTFSILNAMTFRDLPGITEQDRLVTFSVSVLDDGRRISRGLLAWTDVEALHAHPELFSGVAAAGPIEVAVEAGRGAELVRAEAVSDAYFRVLGARPGLGSFFSEEGTSPSLGSVVVSHRFWRSRMGSDPGAVGRTIRVNGRPVVVAGVGEEDFTGMTADDVVEGAATAVALWVPIGMTWALPSSVREDPLAVEAAWLRPLARLAPGVSRGKLEAALPALAGELERAHPTERAGAALVHGDLVFGPGAGPWRPGLTLLGFMIVPTLVLLVACANAASLLLARATERRRELALRKALGATRRGLVRQLLIESVLLAGVAGGAGLLVAVGARRIAALFAVSLSMDTPLDLRVFGYALGASLFTGVVFGLLPALRASGVEVREGLGGYGRGGDGRAESRLHDGLVVAQVALGLLLLVSSGLFVRSARHGLTVETGMDEERMLLLSVDLSVLGYDEVGGAALYGRLVQGVRGLPGVEAAGWADRPPLQGHPSALAAPAQADDGSGERVSVARVGDGVLEAAGISPLAGRILQASDALAGARVAVLNEAAARRLWPGRSALGRTLRLDTESEPLEVVGIVRDSHATLYGRHEPIAYVPRGAAWAPRATLWIRTTGEPTTLQPAVAALVRDIDPGLPPRLLEPALEVRRRMLAPFRSSASALGVLGGLAVMLAAAGLYGTLAHGVGRRTREIGVRMALGASRAGVVRMVLGRALRMAALGLVVGFFLAATVATLLRRALFGTSPTDPWVYGWITLLILGVTVLAACLPALRAASVEPVRAITAD